MNFPLVSIIIPVYNGSNYLAQAIDSALNQTYKNIEILVINDGSNDDGATERIALSYGDKIKYIHKENGGTASALNAGICNMSGEYFSWLSHDDLYFPDKVEKQINAILQSSNPTSTIISSRGMLINKDNEQLKAVKRKFVAGEKSSTEALKWISHGKGINGCAVLLPKAIIDKIGLFDNVFIYLNDLEYWYRVFLSNANLFFTDDVLVKTRIHNQQASKTKRHLLNNEKHLLADKLLNSIYTAETDKFEALVQVAYFCASENLKIEYKKAKSMLVETKKFKFKLRSHLSFTWARGYFIRFLKDLRNKIFFHR